MNDLETTTFPDGCEIFSGKIPDTFIPWEPGSAEFEELWNLHPTAYSEAFVHGRGQVEGTHIITVSLGEERIFRMRSYPSGAPRHDFVLQHRDFIVIPWKTNRCWTHEVPRFARYMGKRISITIRAFH